MLSDTRASMAAISPNKGMENNQRWDYFLKLVYISNSFQLQPKSKFVLVNISNLRTYRVKLFLDEH